MLQKLYSWYGKRPAQVVIGILGILAVTALYFTFFKSAEEPSTIVSPKLIVTVKSVKNINFENSFSSVGVVEAISEAKLQTEAGGRIAKSLFGCVK